MYGDKKGFKKGIWLGVNFHPSDLHNAGELADWVSESLESSMP